MNEKNTSHLLVPKPQISWGKSGGQKSNLGQAPLISYTRIELQLPGGLSSYGHSILFYPFNLKLKGQSLVDHYDITMIYRSKHLYLLWNMLTLGSALQIFQQTSVTD